MSDLSDGIAKRLAYNVNNRLARKDSAFDEYTRIFPLTRLLVEAVEALEWYSEQCVWIELRKDKWFENGEKAKQALARIRAEVDK